MKSLHYLALAGSLVASSLAAAQSNPPLRIAEHGYFFTGGAYRDTPDGRFMTGNMYVEYFIPEVRAHATPIVMFSGGGQSGLNYTGTPDGREGWMQFFVRRGYAVYVLDQPSRARSAHQPEVGNMTRLPVARVQQQFTAPERYNLWPQAKLHTQWPGAGIEGDPHFDQFFGQNYPSLASFPRQQELNRDAGAALLDKIGPSILFTHSQSGAFGWLVADARPKLVRAIVAMEPSGPPVYDNQTVGAPDWFKDGPFSKPYGLTAPPLTYDPPLAKPEDLKFIQQDKADGSELVRCWAQQEPARKLANIQHIPVLVVQTEASYHAPYDHCTVRYLKQAGVSHTTFVRLADKDIKGNGHMLMIEKNNQAIAKVAFKWMAGIVRDKPKKAR